MHKEKITFEDHKQLILKIFVDIITQNELFFQTLEDKSIFWNDDYELVFGMVYKSLKNIKENTTEEDNFFHPVYNTEEDTDLPGHYYEKPSWTTTKTSKPLINSPTTGK